MGVLLVVQAKHNRAVDAEFQHSPCYLLDSNKMPVGLAARDTRSVTPLGNEFIITKIMTVIPTQAMHIIDPIGNHIGLPTNLGEQFV